MDTAASASETGGNRPTFGFAIPIDRALAIAARLSANGGTPTTSRGYLGLQVGPPTPDQLRRRRGHLHERDSPAAGAGIEPGDIITSLGGQQVISADGLTQMLARTTAGELVTVGWTDQFGESHTAEVTLDSGPAD